MRAACVHRCVHEILPHQTTRDTSCPPREFPGDDRSASERYDGGNAHRLRLWPGRYACAGDPVGWHQSCTGRRRGRRGRR